ncbi:MAG: hypothetical protein BWX64_01988 [Acidobacteria bacterium ADurb.Bin051]|jgi:hypothetical protein|nr:hypothetical protein [Acidobacteriota bacterium]OQC37445.1 MAG: hypothetical protein BWX64_01988 [Acidobacteria bacterium ADurb.Bin051]
MNETRPGRLMMVPAALLSEIVFVVSAWWALPLARARTENPLEAGLLYSGLYAAVFTLVYAGLVLWLRMRVGHLVDPDDIRFLGVSLPALHARTGLRWIDLVGLLASGGVFALCLLRPAMLFLAPFPLLTAFGFLGGLLVGSSAPWPLERRGAAG